MLVNNIKDLKFKLGEKFENYHILIVNDTMYISDDFYKLIEQNNIGFNSKSKHCHVTLSFKDASTRKLNNKAWRLCGRSGDYGFGQWFYTKKFTLGVRVKRESIKKIVELYMISPLYINEIRKEKLLRIKDKIYEI